MTERMDRALWMPVTNATGCLLYLITETVSVNREVGGTTLGTDRGKNVSDTSHRSICLKLPAPARRQRGVERIRRRPRARHAVLHRDLIRIVDRPVQTNYPARSRY